MWKERRKKKLRKIYSKHNNEMEIKRNYDKKKTQLKQRKREKENEK